MPITIEETIRLKNEGFTAEEIQNLAQVIQEPKPAPVARQQDNQPAFDQEAVNNLINTKFEELKNTIHAQNVQSTNIQGAELRPDPVKVLGSILSPDK